MANARADAENTVASNQYSSISANEKAARYFFSSSSKPENTKMLAVLPSPTQESAGAILRELCCFSPATVPVPVVWITATLCRLARCTCSGRTLGIQAVRLRERRQDSFSHSGALEHRGASERQPPDVWVCSPRRIRRCKSGGKASRSTPSGHFIIFVEFMSSERLFPVWLASE